MKACAGCGQQVANRAKFCPHCGAATPPTTTATKTAAAKQTAAPEPELLVAGAGPERTWVERVLGGDWRSAAYAAVPAVLLAVALGLAANSYLLWTGSGDNFGHSAGGYFHSAIALMAMAFGSPQFTHGGTGADAGTFSAGVAPLTISIVVLVTFALLLRTYLSADTRVARATGAVRAALLAAFLLSMVSFGGYSTTRLLDSKLHVTTSPPRVFGWSLLLFGIVGIAVAVRPRELLRERASTDAAMARLTGEWWLPVQGAAVAMATAIIGGGLAALAIIVAQDDGNRLDVLKALSILLAYFVNLGVDVFQVSMGAALHASVAGGDGGSASVSLFDRHGLSAGYFGLLLLPPLAIAAGVAWMRRYRNVVSPQTLARSCYRMAAPAVLIYLLVAVPSRVGYEYGGQEGFGGGHAGPEILLGALILGAWFLVLGFAAGRYLLTLPPSPFAGTPPEPRWRIRPILAAPVAIVALVLGLVAGGAGVATADDKNKDGDIGAVGSFLLFGAFATAELSSDGGVTSGGGSAVVAPLTPVPITPVDPVTDAQAQSALRDLAVAEETYFTTYGVYTASEFDLDLIHQPGILFTTIQADSTSFCAEALVVSTGTAFTYDSTVGTVTDGRGC
ncbi:MAG: hypothetical protein QOJ03_1661 [Frankiaceae bacterium]|nr:hypothetical protein [Frankiaceae bacterium]